MDISLETRMDVLCRQVTRDSFPIMARGIKALLEPIACARPIPPGGPTNEQYRIESLKDVADMVNPANLDSMVGNLIMILLVTLQRRDVEPDFVYPAQLFGLVDNHKCELQFDLTDEDGSPCVPQKLTYVDGILRDTLVWRYADFPLVQDNVPNMATAWQELIEGKTELVYIAREDAAGLHCSITGTLLADKAFQTVEEYRFFAEPASPPPQTPPETAQPADQTS